MRVDRRVVIASAAALVSGLAVGSPPAGAEPGSGLTSNARGDTFTYRTAPDETLDVEITSDTHVLVFIDRSGQGLGPAPSDCTTATDPEGQDTLTCPAPRLRHLVLELGSGDDFVTMFFLAAGVSSVTHAGNGMNIIQAGDGNDVVIGGDDWDTLYGGWGDDYIEAGRGGGKLVGIAGDDVLIGGDDPDGETIYGDEGNDVIVAGGGFDEVFGGPGADRIDGGDSADGLYGQGGDDVIEGGRGQDYLEGNGGDDQLNDVGGNDYLDGGKGRDLLDSGPGDDELVARDGERDTLRCGNGSDVAKVDVTPEAAPPVACERVLPKP